MTPDFHRRIASPRAMTLLEVLVVIGLIVTLLTLAVPAIGGIQRAQHLSTAGALVRDHLMYARQLAASRNSTVYLHFSQARGLFVLTAVNREGVVQPIERAVRLPEGVRLMSTSAWSSLMALPEEVIEVAGEAVSCRRIGYRPSGRTDLDADAQWFLTLTVSGHHTDPGSNFLTLVIDPITARVYPYQP